MTRQWGPATRRVFPMLVIRISLTSWLFVGTPALGRDGVLTPGSFRHDPNGPDQVVWATAESPAIRFLSLRFAVGAGDAIDKAGVRIYRLDDQGFEGFRDHDATRWARLDSIEFRALTIPLPDDPRVGPEFSRWRGYRIWLDDRDRLIWCGRDSTTTRESRVGRFEELFRREEKTKTISDRVILVPGWVCDAVAMRIDVSRFANGDPSNDPANGAPGGDLAGLINGLPSLDSLGVTTLILSSLVRTAADDPAAVLDLMTVDPRFGDLAQFRRLVERAHARKMKVIGTLPLARISRAHPWVRDAVEWKEESAFRSFFMLPETADGQPVATTDTTGSVPWNGSNPEVVEEMLAPVHLWSQTRMDGWYLPDLDDQPREFWLSMAATMKALDPTAWIIGVSAEAPVRWITGELVDALDTAAFGRAVSLFTTGEDDDAVHLARSLDRVRIDTPEPFTRTAWNSLTSTDRTDDPGRRLALLLQMTSEGVPVIDALVPLEANERRRLREMIQIRREHASLRRGSFDTVLQLKSAWAVLRRTSDEMFLVVINRGDQPLSARIPMPGSLGQIRQRDAIDLLSGSRHALRSGELFLKDVPPGAGALIQLR
ncbi:MAG: alpha-amylase family glycosyl hydrolase [Candidatus Eisenbacteria bacterium]|nr:alpha-amylase family glycosyl hydrolase [Candidatus Eisenbacteria bacterium]